MDNSDDAGANDPAHHTQQRPHRASQEEGRPRSTSTTLRFRGAIRARLRTGLSSLRRGLPTRTTLPRDTIAGLVGAIGSVPSGIASGVLAGVNPLYGLYASMIGPIFGGLFASTELLLVTTTSAASIAAGQALAPTSNDARATTLFLLVVLIGIAQVVAGFFRLGSLTRFVSHSVMIGFLSGIACLIILGQLGNFTGYAAQGSNKVSQALDLLLHLNKIDLHATLVGAVTLALAILLPRTPLRALGTLVALLIPSAFVWLIGWSDVILVRDSSPIPRGFPLPALPSISALSFNVVTSALALAAIILVQGAGVSQSIPNADGSPSSPSRDLAAQGLANVASGLFHGLPVGGSLGQTALNVSAGAQTRWASILSGVWMALVLLLVPGLVGYVAMPSLAALLILAGSRTIRFSEGLSIWRTRWTSRLAVITTFFATLFLPIQVAVGIGAALSAIFHLNEASSDIVLVEQIRWPDGRMEERKPPKQLPSDRVTVLDVYGSLFYAGAWTLARSLPSPQGAVRPVVVLRLRGRASIGATLIDVLSDYAERLQRAGGRLYLSGVQGQVLHQLIRTNKLDVQGPVAVYQATNILGESTGQATLDADTWLLSRQAQASSSSPDNAPEP